MYFLGRGEKVSKLLTEKRYINQSPRAQIPLLENSDRLFLPEFELRYVAPPHINKAERIKGIVYLASPLRFQSYADYMSC